MTVSKQHHQDSQTSNKNLSRIIVDIGRNDTDDVNDDSQTQSTVAKGYSEFRGCKSYLHTFPKTLLCYHNATITYEIIHNGVNQDGIASGIADIFEISVHYSQYDRFNEVPMTIKIIDKDEKVTYYVSLGFGTNKWEEFSTEQEQMIANMIDARNAIVFKDFVTVDTNVEGLQISPDEQEKCRHKKRRNKTSDALNPRVEIANVYDSRNTRYIKYTHKYKNSIRLLCVRIENAFIEFKESVLGIPCKKISLFYVNGERTRDNVHALELVSSDQRKYYYRIEMGEWTLVDSPAELSKLFPRNILLVR